MAVGDWHDIGGYRFRETLFGPTVERRCSDCGAVTYATPEAEDPRCLDCARKFHGVAPTSVKPLRARFLRAHGAPGLSGDVRYTVDEIKMAAARKRFAPGGLCSVCKYPLDPVHRREGFDTHPICEVENG